MHCTSFCRDASNDCCFVHLLHLTSCFLLPLITLVQRNVLLMYLLRLDRFKLLLLYHCCAMCWARLWKGKKFIQSFDKEVFPLPYQNRELGRHRCRYQRYIKIGLKVVGLKGVKWICLAQNWCTLRVVVNTIVLENSLLLVARGLWSLELV
jgi:hypothetical protein